MLFLVDDLALSDTTEGGSLFHQTPSFSRLMREGIRFVSGYSASSLCSASRAALLTGRSPHRVGITGAIVCGPSCTPIDAPSLPSSAAIWQKVVTPTFRTRLPLGETTLAEVLRSRHYATGHFGKWHLGGSGYGPLEQGFDVSVGAAPSGNPPTYFSPYGIATLKNGAPGEYLTDRLTSEAISFIDAHRDWPFFVALWHYGVHTPLEAPETLVDEFRTRRDPSDSQRNATYAAMIERVDASLGRLLDRIDALGLGENTLIIATSDNGGLLLDDAGGVARSVTSAAPYRGGKAHIYDGGTRVPFGMRWKGRIDPGSVDTTPVIGTDVFATVVEAAGIPESERPPTDGTSLMPLFAGGTLAAERPLVWHFPHYIPGPQLSGRPIDEQLFWALPSSAVRVGDSKLVCVYGEGRTPGTHRYELYDLAADPGETIDRSALDEETVARLRAVLEDDLARSGALVPVANPRYRAPYDGWRCSAQCTGRLGNGVLVLTSTGNDPYVFGPPMTVPTPSRWTFRVRSVADISYRLYYGLESDPTFIAARSIEAQVPGGDAFVDVTFEVPNSGGDPIAAMRFDVGGVGAVVELDAITVVDPSMPSTTLAAWSFSGIDGVTVGGVWYSHRDCAVAHSSAGLDVVMGGAAPTVVSSYVALFGPLRVRLAMRCAGSGDGLLAWSSEPDFVEDASRTVSFPIVHDGALHEYTIDLEGEPDSVIQRLALRLGDGPGSAAVEKVSVFQVGAPGESLVAQWEFTG